MSANRLITKMDNLKPVREYWCTDCDHNVVRSDTPSSGGFFLIFGHQYIPGGEDGDYHGVLFALCPECQKNHPVQH